MTVTLGDALDAMAGFPEVEPADFVRRGLLVIAPHPDDESLGCGGLIATCRAAGLPVSILIVSDGAGSHPGSTLFPPMVLAALRQQEAILAAAALGVGPSHVHFAGLPDRSVPISGYEAERACDRIAALAATADVVAVTWRHDPHGDHKACFALARAAVRRVPGATLWEYPIWGLTLPPHMPLPGERPRGVRVRVSDHLPAKRRAIAAHASQTTALIVDDPKGFRLTPDMLARFDTPWETFIESPP
ncbi:LmbE family N-acetylglucosaminyl deacetylase [Ancylobacter aquaticus]|uniref:LmbE family N-acetylglucosaminyl deacetylase n=1 Tax=Ancylobacter aquaticus TaxID=100 RepID=A0A4R1I2E2_ANCAQ|nr:PIG-L deacetylase family protein [Ancylobacter aquaticus]TCK28111.1 LmbE family N-acetylglucosaminyl deacetylase [Ancylobacter aquaticus]